MNYGIYGIYVYIICIVQWHSNPKVLDIYNSFQNVNYSEIQEEIFQRIHVTRIALKL